MAILYFEGGPNDGANSTPPEALRAPRSEHSSDRRRDLFHLAISVNGSLRAAERPCFPAWPVDAFREVVAERHHKSLSRKVLCANRAAESSPCPWHGDFDPRASDSDCAVGAREGAKGPLDRGVLHPAALHGAADCPGSGSDWICAAERPLVRCIELLTHTFLRDSGASVHLSLNRRRYPGHRCTHVDRCRPKSRGRLGHDPLAGVAAQPAQCRHFVIVPHSNSRSGRVHDGPGAPQAHVPTVLGRVRRS